MNFGRIIWTVPTIVTFLGTFLILAGISFGNAKILEKLPAHQRERIEVLYKGEKHSEILLATIYYIQKTAMVLAVSGKGYKEGSVTQGKFVPEQETDYIFCTVGEEWGFLGKHPFGIILCCIYWQNLLFSRKPKQHLTEFSVIVLLEFS